MMRLEGRMLDATVQRSYVCFECKLLLVERNSASIPFGIVKYRYFIQVSILEIATGIVTKNAKKKNNNNNKNLIEITRKWGKRYGNLKQFEARKSKYVTNLWM